MRASLCRRRTWTPCLRPLTSCCRTLLADSSWERLGWLQRGDLERIQALGARAGLPTRPPGIPPAEFLQLMAVDKKVLDGQLRLVLLKGIGKALVAGDFSPAVLRNMLDAYG